MCLRKWRHMYIQNLIQFKYTCTEYSIKMLLTDGDFSPISNIHLKFESNTGTGLLAINIFLAYFPRADSSS